MNITFYKKGFFLTVLSFCCGLLFSQQILNGSFEKHRFECDYNLSNQAFNSGMSNITAFGEQSEIDVIANSCDLGMAVEGNHFIAMYHRNQLSDAIAFDLSSPLEEGKRYFLRFSSKLGIDTLGKNAQVEIGLSNFPDSFGMSILLSSKVGVSWQQEFEVISPIDASFITVKIASEEENWIFLDDFALYCPVINLGNDTAYCEVNNIVLEVNDAELYERIEWNTATVTSALAINEAGVYWVEGIVGGCSVRDTIDIQEIAYNCNCEVYVPNIFSPNNDNLNDQLIPLSPCEFLDYEFAVFDRWGTRVFYSLKPDEFWNGTYNDQFLSAGNYVYFVRYRFIFQTRQQQKQGYISIVR